LAALIAAVYVAVLAATAPATGYVRDEGYYFRAAQEYGGWWDVLFSKRFTEAFAKDEIARHFSFNTEHPALVKLSQGLTHRVLHEWLGLTEPAQGYRFSGFLFAGLSLLATFLLGRALISAKVGLLAALFVAAIPRYFYDAHLACFDVPITAMWTLSLYFFWRAFSAPADKAKRRAVAAGIVFGLALATKLNSLFLPFVFILVWLSAIDLSGFRFRTRPEGGRELYLPPIPWVLIACAIIGPLVFIAHWPWLWHETFLRIGKYIGFHMHHEHYPIRYFGEVLVKPPFPIAFPFVMSLYTVPGPLLALGALGLLVATARAMSRKAPAEALLAIATLLPFIMIALPSTPIFGGVKHWYNAMPTLAILAARLVFEAADAVSRWQPRLLRWAPATLGALALLPGVLGIQASHPNGISYYNELAGGLRGGAALGMQRSFWGGLNRPLLDEISALPNGTRVFFDHTNWDAVRMYQKEGALPKHIHFANEARSADAATLFEDRENATQEDAIWDIVGTRPIAGVYADEVTLVQLYARRVAGSP
jgi:4-amino-4-deoxy-L-arabinose transferase-like glycosyltransferase